MIVETLEEDVDTNYVEIKTESPWQEKVVNGKKILRAATTTPDSPVEVTDYH